MHLKLLIARDGSGSDIDEFNFCFPPDSWSGNGGKLRFACTFLDHTSSYEVYSDASYWDKCEWYHVAGVIHPEDGLTLFINGIKQADENSGFTNSIASNEYTTTIGCWGDDYNRFSYVVMDEIRFSTNVRYTSNFIPPCEYENDSFTRGLYKLDEGMGDVVNDETTFSFQGQNYGATYFPETLCNYPTETLQNDEIMEWFIFPNPLLNDKVTIYKDDGFNGELQIFNSLGQRTNHYYLQKNKQISVDMCKNANGIYFLKYNDINSKQNSIKKLLKWK